MTGELNEIQINNVLTSQVLGRLACTDGKQPYIVPLTFCFDGKCIYGQTRPGKKLTILRKNPNVCFEVDQMTDMANWQSVLVSGKFEELNEADAQNARQLLFDRIFPMSTSCTIHPHEHIVTSRVPDKNRIKPVMYRIIISAKSGRFEKR
jgi:uncharacterized protein